MLKQRLITGFSMAAVTIAAFSLQGWPGAVFFLLFAGALVVCGIHEFCRLSAAAGAPGLPRLTSAAVLLLLGTTVSRFYAPGFPNVSTHYLEVLVILGFITAGFVHTFRESDKKRALLELLVSAGAFLYVGWTLNFLAKIYFSCGLERDGRLLALFVIAVTKMGDVGAYAVGVSTAMRPQGNHKIAPGISPKKSWEGLFGGIAACVLTAVFLWPVLGAELTFAGEHIFVSRRSVVLFGVLAAVVGLVSDLSESMLKRVADAKDSGRLPGLGGVLDMLDSLILVAPCAYAYFWLLHRFSWF